MHDTDTDLPSSNQLRSQPKGQPTPTPNKECAKMSVSAAAYADTKPQGLIGKLLRLCTQLFARKSILKDTQPQPAMLAERAATSLAVHMQPPMAFKGDTTSTLITPMGAYAGKPLEQAMRKRAELQFKNMDISQITMN